MQAVRRSDRSSVAHDDDLDGGVGDALEALCEVLARCGSVKPCEVMIEFDSAMRVAAMQLPRPRAGAPRPGKLRRCYSHGRVGLGQHLARPASTQRTVCIASRSLAHTPST